MDTVDIQVGGGGTTVVVSRLRIRRRVCRSFVRHRVQVVIA